MENNPRKKSRQRKRKRFLIRLLKVIGVLLILAGILALLYRFAFTIKEISVEGNSQYTDEEIIEMVGLNEPPDNTLYHFWMNRNLVIEDVPFINDIKISLSGKNGLYVDVIEKEIIGCFKESGTYYYFDNDGIIVESSTGKQADHLLVVGLTSESDEIGHQIDSGSLRTFDFIRTLSQLIGKYEMNVAQLEISDDGTMTLYVGKIKVKIGKGDNIEEKMIGITDLLPHLEGQRGTLYMENYDSTQDSIIFDPES